MLCGPSSGIGAGLWGGWFLGRGGEGAVSDMARQEVLGSTYHAGIPPHGSPSVPLHAPDPSRWPHIPFEQGGGGGGLLGAISSSLPNGIDWNLEKKRNRSVSSEKQQNE